MLRKGLIAGVVNLIIGMGLNTGLQKLTPALAKEYQNQVLFRSWQDPLMMVYFAYPFILGIVLAYLWNMIGKDFKGSATNKAFRFAKFYFLIATIPGMFISYTCFQISFLMILGWTMTGFVQAFVAGFVFAKMK